MTGPVVKWHAGHGCPYDPDGQVAVDVSHSRARYLHLSRLDPEARRDWVAPRDQQRIRVYRAQERFASSRPIRQLGSMESVEDFIDMVAANDWWRTNAPHRPYVGAGDGRSRRSACSTGSEIRVPRQYRTPWTIYHELAHEAAFCPVTQGHGPEFAGVMLLLVDVFEGSEASKDLLKAFRDGRVRADVDLSWRGDNEMPFDLTFIPIPCPISKGTSTPPLVAVG
jgi:hypothetical protein